ncbi:MAG: OmpA family protein [SAR324 cluster bacterium]|nr:OmpA family protein [SAR324 cluster bacterium]MBL7035078.1 OmpA family protein [SAR324 cluster bacterium]
MGELIDEEDCEVCVPFDQEWIFTYGDLVTLLLCFFILLFSTCTYETMKFKSLAASFKPLPAGTPFMNEGKDSIVEQIAQQLEESELGDDANINVEEKGVVIAFKASAYFKAGSAKLNAKALKEMARFSKLIFLLPNKIQIEGHTEKNPPKNWDSTWELAGARAAKIARYFIQNGLEPAKITVKSFGATRPLFRESSAAQRSLNNRVEVVVLP